MSNEFSARPPRSEEASIETLRARLPIFDVGPTAAEASGEQNPATPDVGIYRVEQDEPPASQEQPKIATDGAGAGSRSGNCASTGAGTRRLGGRYRDIEIPEGGGYERHHMPADQASPLSTKLGPSILMETVDHYKTASWGRSKKAPAYRKEQKRLVDEGRFDDAIEMDIDDIQHLFGDKYDEHILQLVDCL